MRQSLVVGRGSYAPPPDVCGAATRTRGRSAPRRRTILSLALTLALLPGLALAQAPRGAQLDRFLAGLGRPYVIGLAGDSGSGKSTFATGLQQTLGADRVKIICVDDYHRLDREGRKAAGVTALDPVATDLGRLARDLAALRQGQAIQKPVYDHSNGTLAPAVPFSPSKIIIVEGLHPLATPELRQQLDLSIYFDPTPRVKEGWKIKRDVAERGHTLEAVRKEIRARKPDFKRFVEPQREVAGVLVSFDRSKLGAAEERLLPSTTESLIVKLHEQGLTPAAQRLRVNRSGAGFVLRGERRRDGTGVTTLDGALPEAALAREVGLLQRLTGASPTLERRSATLDAARVLVAKRIVLDLARKAAPSLRRARTSNVYSNVTLNAAPSAPAMAAAR